MSIIFIVFALFIFGCATSRKDLVTGKRVGNDYPLEYDKVLGRVILEQQRILSRNSKIEIDSKKNLKELK